jgi:Domain of Unknown Function (DUF1259)
MGSQAMVTGDLVLLETEIKPAMTKLIEGGLDITAVHNHLLRANPATFYMHVGGHGDPAKNGRCNSDGFGRKQDGVVSAIAAGGPASHGSRRCATR